MTVPLEQILAASATNNMLSDMAWLAGNAATAYLSYQTINGAHKLQQWWNTNPAQRSVVAATPNLLNRLNPIPKTAKLVATLLAVPSVNTALGKMTDAIETIVPVREPLRYLAQNLIAPLQARWMRPVVESAEQSGYLTVQPYTKTFLGLSQGEDLTQKLLFNPTKDMNNHRELYSSLDQAIVCLQDAQGCIYSRTGDLVTAATTQINEIAAQTDQRTALIAGGTLLAGSLVAYGIYKVCGYSNVNNNNNQAVANAQNNVVLNLQVLPAPQPAP